MPLELPRFRQRLLDELDQVERSLLDAQDAAATVVLDQSSVGRLSRMDAMQQQAMAEGLTERLHLSRRQLQAALARLEAGSFGLCCQCEDAIEPARLEHNPSVVFCRTCMQQREDSRAER